MKLDMLTPHLRASVPDPSSPLVHALRMRIGGGRASYHWAVIFQGVHFATISRIDSKFVHDNWEATISSEGADSSALTKQNRSEWDTVLNNLMDRIREALSDRQAETVTIEAPTLELV